MTPAAPRLRFAVLLLFAAGAAAAQPADQELAGKERELQQLRTRIAELLDNPRRTGRRSRCDRDG